MKMKKFLNLYNRYFSSKITKPDESIKHSFTARGLYQFCDYIVEHTTKKLLSNVERSEFKLDMLQHTIDNLPAPRYRLKLPDARQVLVICSVIVTACAVWWTVFDIFYRQ